MIRTCILWGLMSALFLPSFINAAAMEPKPVILIVSMAGIEEFAQAMRKIAGPNFEVRVRDFDHVYPSDLFNVTYVLAHGHLQQNELKRIPKFLGKEVMEQENKTLVLFRSSSDDPIEIDPATNKLFNGQIFQLDMVIRSEAYHVVENDRSKAFVNWFKEKILEKSQVPVLQKAGKIDPVLQQKIERLANDLAAVTKEVQRLNQEFTEIMRQLNQ